MTIEESKLAYKVSLKSMIINLVLFAIKGIFGVLISSTSLLSDALHSLTDILSTFIVLIGIKISNKPTDESHPYGHEKIECIIALLLGIMLFAIGIAIGWKGVLKLLNPEKDTPQFILLNTGAIIVAIISIVAKEWMYKFTIKCAKSIGSASMNADAWHHRSDAYSSIGSLIGVIGMRLGYPGIDAIACIIISIFIFHAALDICVDACRELIDSSCSPELIKEIEELVLNHEDVLAIDVLKVRQFGCKIYIDLEITLSNSISFEYAHDIAHSVHDDIEEKISYTKHCMIHFNPSSLINHHHL